MDIVVSVYETYHFKVQKEWGAEVVIFYEDHNYPNWLSLKATALKKDKDNNCFKL